MSTENEIPQNESFGRRLWTAFKRLFIFLFRVLLTLLIIGAIGVAIYLGAPVLIDEYLLKDVKINSEQIQDINAELEVNTEFLSQRLADLQNRIDTLEIQSDNDKQTIDDLKTQLAEANELIQNQKSSLDQLEVIQLSLDEYDQTLTSFEEQVSDHQGDIEDIRGKLSTLNQSVEVNQAELEELSAQLETQPQIGTLRQELELLKVMELITRARVSIGQNNIGLATDDLLAAQNLLASLSTELPAYQAKYLSDIVQRLELATENLTSSIDLVDEDLEVAWQLLLQQLPVEAGEEELTPTPGSAQEEAETPTPTPQP